MKEHTKKHMAVIRTIKELNKTTKGLILVECMLMQCNKQGTSMCF